jgi:hypothetical protein
MILLRLVSEQWFITGAVGLSGYRHLDAGPIEGRRLYALVGHTRYTAMMAHGTVIYAERQPCRP